MCDARQVSIDGEPVEDAATHPAFEPIVDARARIYDMAREDAYRDPLTCTADGGERSPS